MRKHSLLIQIPSYLLFAVSLVFPFSSFSQTHTQTALIHILAEPVELSTHDVERSPKLEFSISIAVNDHGISRAEAVTQAIDSLKTRLTELSSSDYRVQAVQIEAEYGMDKSKSLGESLSESILESPEFDFEKTENSLKSKIIHPKELTPKMNTAGKPILALTRLKNETAENLKMNMGVLHPETRADQLRASFKYTNILASLLRFGLNGGTMGWVTYQSLEAVSSGMAINVWHAMTFGIVGGLTSGALMLTSPLYLSWVEKNGWLYEKLLNGVSKLGLGAENTQRKIAATLSQALKWGGVLETGFVAVLETVNILFGINIFSGGLGAFAWKTGSAIIMTILAQGTWESFIQKVSSKSFNEIKHRYRDRKKDLEDKKLHLNKSIQDNTNKMTDAQANNFQKLAAELSELDSEIERQHDLEISRLNMKRTLTIMGVSLVSVATVTLKLMGMEMQANSLFASLALTGILAPYADRLLKYLGNRFQKVNSGILKVNARELNKITKIAPDKVLDSQLDKAFESFKGHEKISNKIEFMVKEQERLNSPTKEDIVNSTKIRRPFDKPKSKSKCEGFIKSLLAS